MTRKKAQFGLDTLISYFVFAVFLLFTIFALSLSGCGSAKHKAEGKINLDKGRIADLRASEQLSAYFATEIPVKEALYKGIDDTEDMFKLGTDFNKKTVKEFLDTHPEVYVDRNYAEFVNALYAYRADERIKDVFDAVTKALFHRQLYSKSARDLNSGRLDKLYYSPTISVMYGRQIGFYFGSENLISGNPISGAGGVAFRQLPTHDLKGLTVKFEEYADASAEPLP